MFVFTPIPLLLSLPGLLLGFWAQFRIRSALSKYSGVSSELGVAGAQVARHILDSNGLGHVNVEETRGFLSDHYDPSQKTLRLSPHVYQNDSVVAIGVAAHEAGHALQDSENYGPMSLRSGMVSSVQLGSWLGPILFAIGLAIPSAWGQILALLGLILFGATALFALVTLPVEFDASKRARQVLVSEGIVVSNQEMQGVNAVLNAAALTYVAGAVQAIMALSEYVYLFLFHGRNRGKDETRD
jgi:Zn-dependent membrane protease YugP